MITINPKHREGSTYQPSYEGKGKMINQNPNPKQIPIKKGNLRSQFSEGAQSRTAMRETKLSGETKI